MSYKELAYGGKPLALLSTTAIAAAASGQTSPVALSLAGVKYVALQAVFNYGAGGINVTAYVQTTLDEGLTWIDIACFQFLTAAATKLSAVVFDPATPLPAGTVPTDGALAANTVLNGLLGDQYRVKFGSTGTYTGATNLAIYAVFKR